MTMKAYHEEIRGLFKLIPGRSGCRAVRVALWPLTATRLIERNKMAATNSRSTPSWRYDRSREAPAWVFAFVVFYTLGVIAFLLVVL